jgi:hypothetical protein
MNIILTGKLREPRCGQPYPTVTIAVRQHIYAGAEHMLSS